MPQTKTAAPVLQHRNGQTKKFITCILPHLARVCKVCANFALLGCGLGALCAVAALAQGGGAAAMAGLAACCLGGYAQRCPIDNKFAALFYLPQAGQSLPTRHYNGRWFYGRLCLVGWRNARMTDLPMPLAEELLQKFTPVEVTP